VFLIKRGLISAGSLDNLEHRYIISINNFVMQSKKYCKDSADADQPIQKEKKS
jgi:hypothetical protein